jgi:predicted AAA+ superfamily ATPase
VPFARRSRYCPRTRYRPWEIREIASSQRERIDGEEQGLPSLQKYIASGGFPEFLKTGIDDILVQLQQDILHRDIAVRYGIRDIASLKRLLTYLISNAVRRSQRKILEIGFPL